MNIIDEIITRGVANSIPGKDALKERLTNKKPLNIYLGIDPTATHIHLGHAVPLRKLQALAVLGHNVTFLIGDFTALIGDTSDKDTERPVLTSEQIEENFKTYKKQAEKILDFSKVTIRHNSEWLQTLGFQDILQLAQQFGLGDFMSRELIRKRLDEGKRVGLHETLYPLMQGYDSYYLDTDLQIGGTDQTFNMQAGRTLQKNWRHKESFILATEFLMGTDGRKMSKSWGNAIWLDDTPEDMYAKVMAINDELIPGYFLLGTNVSLEKVEDVKKQLHTGSHPMELKKELAGIIVTELHSSRAAQDAATYFEKTIQKKEIPQEIEEKVWEGEKQVNIIDLLEKLGAVPSRSEAKRLVEQRGLILDGVKPQQASDIVTIKNGSLLQVGKRRFLHIKIN